MERRRASGGMRMPPRSHTVSGALLHSRSQLNSTSGDTAALLPPASPAMPPAAVRRPSRRPSNRPPTQPPLPPPVFEHMEHLDGTQVMLNLGRALLARTLFIVHSLVTIWQTVHVHKNNSYWAFALIAIAILIEGSHTVVMRAGDERRWQAVRVFFIACRFCPSVLLYILATAPPIWLLESALCERRAAGMVPEAGEGIVQVLEQMLLVVLIIGRWLLPKGDISREQLSQILLAYLAISSDIVEFFDVFKEKIVWGDRGVQHAVLAVWTLSLLQFPFVMTVSRARKMRVAITSTCDEIMFERKPGLGQVIYDVDMWAIILANGLQDIPFLLVRLHLMLNYGIFTYTMIFFTCKNALIIALQTYRAFILLNDRYINPRPRYDPAIAMLAKKRMHKKRRRPKQAAPRRQSKPQPQRLKEENEEDGGGHQQVWRGGGGGGGVEHHRHHPHHV